MTQTLVAWFFDGQAPYEGGSPTVTIRNAATGDVFVEDKPMTEVGDGCYSYEVADYDPSVPYVALATESSLTGRDRYAMGAIGDSGRIDRLSQYAVNKKTLDVVDASNLREKVFDDDDTTVIRQALITRADDGSETRTPE